MSELEPTRAAMHYITEEPAKIVRVVQRDEKRAIKEYTELLKIRDILINSDTKSSKMLLQIRPTLPSSIQEGYVQIIVKRWQGMLSTYAECKNVWQKGYVGSIPGCWVQFQCRTNHVAQKYAALFVIEHESMMTCELWSNGQKLREWEFYPDEGTKFGEQLILFSDIANGEILDKWSKYTPTQFKKDDLMEVPVLLPTDWSKKWCVVKQSKLICHCE